MNPITIESHTYDLQQGIFLQSHIQNATQQPLFIESVKLDALPLFSFTDLNSFEDSKQSALNTLGDLVYLKPGDVRQYLYRLEPKQPQAKSTTTIGKLDIIWKSNLGETGKMHSMPIERKLPNQMEVEIALKDIPSNIILEQPFNIRCEVTNRSDSAISPRITFAKAKMTGIMWNGISGLKLGRLAAGTTSSVQLTFFAMKPGVQKITGIRVVDELTEKNYDFDDITDVFVET